MSPLRTLLVASTLLLVALSGCTEPMEPEPTTASMRVGDKFTYQIEFESLVTESSSYAVALHVISAGTAVGHDGLMRPSYTVEINEARSRQPAHMLSEKVPIMQQLATDSGMPLGAVATTPWVGPLTGKPDPPMSKIVQPDAVLMLPYYEPFGMAWAPFVHLHGDAGSIAFWNRTTTATLQADVLELRHSTPIGNTVIIDYFGQSEYLPSEYAIRVVSPDDDLLVNGSAKLTSFEPGDGAIIEVASKAEPGEPFRGEVQMPTMHRHEITGKTMTMPVLSVPSRDIDWEDGVLAVQNDPRVIEYDLQHNHTILCQSSWARNLGLTVGDAIWDPVYDQATQRVISYRQGLPIPGNDFAISAQAIAWQRETPVADFFDPATIDYHESRVGCFGYPDGPVSEIEIGPHYALDSVLSSYDNLTGPDQYDWLQWIIFEPTRSPKPYWHIGKNCWDPDGKTASHLLVDARTGFIEFAELGITGEKMGKCAFGALHPAS